MTNCKLCKSFSTSHFFFTDAYNEGASKHSCKNSCHKREILRVKFAVFFSRSLLAAFNRLYYRTSRTTLLRLSHGTRHGTTVVSFSLSHRTTGGRYCAVSATNSCANTSIGLALNTLNMTTNPRRSLGKERKIDRRLCNYLVRVFVFWFQKT